MYVAASELEIGTITRPYGTVTSVALGFTSTRVMFDHGLAITFDVADRVEVA